MTNDLHHEVELVVAIVKPLQKANREDLKGSIFGYACGLDMTRRDLQSTKRDLQSIAKKQGKSWDMSKYFDGSPIIGEITEVEKAPQIIKANLKFF
mgnify:CR=1 FL=1